MYNFIKYCSDIFYASFDMFVVEFRVVFGFALFVFCILIFVFCVLGFVLTIYETLKKKLISRKQRKTDNDA